MDPTITEIIAVNKKVSNCPREPGKYNPDFNKGKSIKDPKEPQMITHDDT